MKLKLLDALTCEIFGIPILPETTHGELIDLTLAQYAEHGLTRDDATYRVDQAIASGAYRKIIERDEPVEIRRAKRSENK